MIFPGAAGDRDLREREHDEPLLPHHHHQPVPGGQAHCPGHPGRPWRPGGKRPPMACHCPGSPWRAVGKWPEACLCLGHRGDSPLKMILLTFYRLPTATDLTIGDTPTRSDRTCCSPSTSSGQSRIGLVSYYQYTFRLVQDRFSQSVAVQVQVSPG